MVDEHWPYVANAAREGAVDCSGAFSYWYGEFGSYMPHGSNSMWRNYTTEKGKIGSIPLVPGMAVFKRRDWRSQDNQNRYYGDAEGDFYHVGLYIGDDTVAEAKDTAHGCVYSKLSIWSHCAKLRYTDYDAGNDAPSGATPPEEAASAGERETCVETETAFPDGTQGIVATQDGRLNMRKKPSMKGTIIARLDKWSIIDLLERNGDWILVRANGMRGWCAAEYIEIMQKPTYAFHAYGLFEEDAAELDKFCEAMGILSRYIVEEGED